MGEVIRKDAAAIDILADAEATLRGARERGGEAQSLAEERLAAGTLLAQDFGKQLEDARITLGPLEAAVDAENERADRTVARIADEVWNHIGRPAVDPAFDVLFPGGISYYVEGDVEEQPERMLLLAQFFRSGLHPRLSSSDSQAYADQLTTALTTLREKVEAARPARLKVAQLSRMQTALARTAQLQLAALKRLYKAHGMSEAEIHRIIPDRRRASPKTDKPEPSQSA